MSRSYYVIELSARWLTILLVTLGLLMVVAFGLGYGAAWSTMRDGAPEDAAAPSATPEIETEVIPEPTPPTPPPSATAPAATATPRPAPPTAAPPPVSSPTPKPTVQPPPTEAPEGSFWVQVLASSQEGSISEARDKLERLGFDRDHQELVLAEVVGGSELIKLRVGPFPDRRSADRVVQRMRSAGFPDAWVVVP
jgi:cell division septation protein DedD